MLDTGFSVRIAFAYLPFLALNTRHFKFEIGTSALPASRMIVRRRQHPQMSEFMPPLFRILLLAYCIPFGAVSPSQLSLTRILQIFDLHLFDQSNSKCQPCRRDYFGGHCFAKNFARMWMALSYHTRSCLQHKIYTQERCCILSLCCFYILSLLIWIWQEQPYQ